MMRADWLTIDWSGPLTAEPPLSMEQRLAVVSPEAWAAMGQDWAKVGGDMRRAMGRIGNSRSTP